MLLERQAQIIENQNFLLECFLNKNINSMTKKDLNELQNKIKKELKNREKGD